MTSENHSRDQQPNRRRVGSAVQFLFENSLFLIGGAVLGLVWANLDHHSYHELLHASPFTAEWLRHMANLHFLVNDFLMAMFFAIAAKEVWESMLPGGALSNLRRAATPLMATVGGIVAPAGLYLAGAAATGTLESLGRGWAIPCATDIAFSYLVARLIFGNGHPAIAFLLLLAIADDAAGLMILAVFYPQKAMQPEWLLLAVAAVGLALVFQKRLGLHSFWWYILIPGLMSWFSFYEAGIHPALGLVPIIPCLPHAHSDLGIFARREMGRHDSLNEFEHWWRHPVELILGLFGLVNAGVPLSNAGTATVLVLLGLVVGKPLGIGLFTWIGEKMGLEKPHGTDYRHIVTLGMVAGVGFTVALFVSDAAFNVEGIPVGRLDAAKMGALASVLAAVLAGLMGWMLGIQRTPSETNLNPEETSEFDSPSPAEAVERSP